MTCSRLLSAAIISVALAAPAAAAPVLEAELDGTATNNTLATAQAIAAAAFTTPVPLTVFNPPGYHTATVSGRSGPNDVDFYSFTAGAAANVYFDIDNDPFVFDPMLTLFDSSGTMIAFDDDSFPEDPGTAFGYDSFLGVMTLPAAGTYYLAVSQFGNFATGFNGNPSFIPLSRPDDEFGGFELLGATPGDSSFEASGGQRGDPYTLHLSVQQVPEPASMLLLGAGLAGLAARRRLRK